MNGRDTAARELYRVVEVMALLSLSRSVLYEELRSGRLRSVHVGRTRLIPATAITEYVALLEREADALRDGVVTARRSRGEGGLHFDESRQRWIATAALGYDARGKRITRKASGTTKTAAKAKLREILRDHAEGLTVTSGTDTVEDAVRDWLAYGLAGRSAATVANYTTIAEARIIAPLGRDGCATSPRRTSTAGSAPRPTRSAPEPCA